MARIREARFRRTGKKHKFVLYPVALKPLRHSTTQLRRSSLRETVPTYRVSLQDTFGDNEERSRRCINRDYGLTSAARKRMRQADPLIRRG